MSEHVTSPVTYIGVFLALMVLTTVTVGVAFVDLGRLNDVVALSIAFLKAFLVVWIFMGMRYASPLSKLVAVGGLLWLIFLFGLTLVDYLSRTFLN